MEAIKNSLCCCCPSGKTPREENPSSETTPLQHDSSQSVNNYMSGTLQQQQQSEPIAVIPSKPRDSHDHLSTALQLGYSSDTSTSCSVSLSSDNLKAAYRMHKSEKMRKKAHGRSNVVNEGISPQLQCFIIPSFGKDPPENVAVKKMAGDFLRGVRDDFKVIQELIQNDGHKYIYQVDFMCHFAQQKVKEFKEAIEDAMKNLRLRRTEEGRKHDILYTPITGSIILCTYLRTHVWKTILCMVFCHANHLLVINVVLCSAHLVHWTW